MKTHRNAHRALAPQPLGLGLLLGLAVQTSCAVRQSDPAPPPELERMTYCSYRPAGWDLYLYETPGAEPRRLTEHPALDYDGVFSPDGRWVVFTSERTGDPSLFVLDLEQAGAPRLLVRGVGMQDQATISPDGSLLVFVSTHAGDADLYSLPFRPEAALDLELARNLTRHTGGDFRPAFSPDGRQLAFTSDRDGVPARHPRIPFAIQQEGDVYVMDADGSHLRRVTETPGWDGSPAWSRDGRSLFLYSERGDAAAYRIHTLELATGEVRAVTPPELPALSPAVRADGSVVFATWTETEPDRRWSLVSVGPDGELREESSSQLDALNPQVHPRTGALLCHGAPHAQAESIASFPGPFLVDAQRRELALPGRRVEFIAHRQAFTAPPHPRWNEVAFRQSSRRIGLADASGQHASTLLDLDDHPGVFDGVLLHLRQSRDGEWISFTVGPFGGAPSQPADAWRVRVDGTALTPLTPDTPGNDGLAEFSADGRRFVFRSGRTGDFDVFLAEANGGSPRNLTAHPASDTFPALSPRGDQLAFSSDRGGELDAATGRRNFDIYTLELDADGASGALTRVTNNPSQNAHVGYSPDGAWLIYASGEHGISDEAPLVQEVVFNPQLYGELYAHRLSDGLTLRLTHNKWEDGAPVWEGPARAPARPPVALALAGLLESDGAEAAAREYRALQEAAPQGYRFGEGGLLPLAARFRREDKLEAAAETFRLLTLVQPASARTHLELAELYYAMERPEEALLEYRRVLEADPGNLEAEWSLFRLIAENGPTPALSAEQLDRLVGSYRAESDGRELVVSRAELQLSALLPGAPGPLPLSASSEARFFTTEFPLTLTFALGAEGDASAIELKFTGGTERLLRR